MNMFGIRGSGVFGGPIVMEDVKQRVARLVLENRKAAEDPNGPYRYNLGEKDTGDVSHCMSHELAAHKGSMIVIAGVFNYWTYDNAKEFAKALSKEFGTEVMHMCHDLEREETQCMVWLEGKPLLEVAENPLGRVLRRIT